jgi:hypothetical protein
MSIEGRPTTASGHQSDSSPRIPFREMGRLKGRSTVIPRQMRTAIDALREYVYVSQHAAAFRKEKMIWMHPVLRSGGLRRGTFLPVEEAKQRLLCRQQHEDGAMAFSFAHPPEMPLQPDIDLR